MRGTQPLAGDDCRSRGWSASGELLHGDELHELDLGFFGQQLAADLRERPGDLAFEVRPATRLARERVEDPVGRLVDLERVPGDRGLLGQRELAALFEERSKRFGPAGSGLEQGQDSERRVHGCSFRILISGRNGGATYGVGWRAAAGEAMLGAVSTFDPAAYKRTTTDQWQTAAEPWHRW